MHDFMKHGLFGLFILGAATCALSAISAAVILCVDSPLFSAGQIEKLAGVAMVFGTGVGTCVLCALGVAALEFTDRPPST